MQSARARLVAAVFQKVARIVILEVLAQLKEGSKHCLVAARGSRSWQNMVSADTLNELEQVEGVTERQSARRRRDGVEG